MVLPIIISKIDHAHVVIEVHAKNLEKNQTRKQTEEQEVSIYPNMCINGFWNDIVKDNDYV